ncbi:hypothetical protein [Collimonas fungivorans]|uniref:hypothetical protein n=1 Tax=Collimonas fungivorans TaxID=158899 RepID=UPI000ADBB430|nr:hypothetical protein [Collimonas fungivorans]
MKKVMVSGLFLSTLLTGCSAAWGPTFNAYSIGIANGAAIYEVECHGLLTDASSCQKAAERICGEQPVNILEKTGNLSQSGDDIKDPRVLRFQCSESAQ